MEPRLFTRNKCLNCISMIRRQCMLVGRSISMILSRAWPFQRPIIKTPLLRRPPGKLRYVHCKSLHFQVYFLLEHPIANTHSPTLVIQDAAPSDSLGISHLIRAYQVHGHLAAQLDPLGIHTRDSFPFRPSNLANLDKDGYPEQLGIEYHGFSEIDLDRPLNFKGTSTGGNKGYLEELASANQKSTLRLILKELRKTYCGTLGVEYMHIGDPRKVNWMRERIEKPHWLFYDQEKKQHIYERLCFADTFENFLAQKFNTTKRFGLDGGEAIVPALKDAIDRASELGAHSFVIGMPHRGRLNILANVMRKPMPLIFSEFMGTHYELSEHFKTDGEWAVSGDVKYHLGSSMDRTYPDGRKIHLSLVANPSHLECVNAVVVGKARAKQYYCGNRYVSLGRVTQVLNRTASNDQ